MSTPALAFTDVETTHLSELYGHAWEIAVIRRDPDGIETENLWQVRVDLTNASEKSLEIGGYNERFAVPDDWDAMSIHTYVDGTTKRTKLSRAEMIDEVGELLAGAVMVGSNAAFDDRFLRKLFVDPPWHYRPVCIATLAAGFLYGQAERMTARDCDAKWYGKVAQRIGWPWKSYNASEAAGIPRPSADEAHTALGDARWARDLYDLVTIPNSFYTTTDEQLAKMAGEALTRANGGGR